jgi:hypothetical protein
MCVDLSHCVRAFPADPCGVSCYPGLPTELGCGSCASSAAASIGMQAVSRLSWPCKLGGAA